LSGNNYAITVKVIKTLIRLCR